MQKSRRLHPESSKRNEKTANNNRRLKAIRKINPLMKCKCGRSEPLEIHHPNGNGKEDRERYPGASWYQAIISGERSIDDLEVVCKICNLQAYVDELCAKYPNS